MKRLLSVCLSLCIMVSVFVSFDITASAKTTMKKTTVSVSNISSGVNVSWKKVSGAKNYKVYRKAPGAKKYSVVKTTNNKTVRFLDKKVAVGKTYSYQVVAVKDSKTKTTSKAKSIVRLLAPKNIKLQAYAKNTDLTIDNNDKLDDYNVTGVKISWTKSKYANKYDIYKKEGKGKFYKIATTGNVSSYVDEEVFDITTCYYRVLARKNTSTSGSSQTKKIVYVEPTEFMMLSPLSSGMKLEWDTISGCDGFKIYRSPNGKTGTYSLITTAAKNKVSYLDKNVQLGKTYYYKVVVYKGSLKSIGMTIKGKYQASSTINVKVGESNDTLKNELQKELKEMNKEYGETLSFAEIQKMLKLIPLNKSIATVSDDYVVTGVSKGSTKAKMQISMYGVTEEVGFILINVN